MCADDVLICPGGISLGRNLEGGCVCPPDEDDDGENVVAIEGVSSSNAEADSPVEIDGGDIIEEDGGEGATVEDRGSRRQFPPIFFSNEKK